MQKTTLRLISPRISLASGCLALLLCTPCRAVAQQYPVARTLPAPSASQAHVDAVIRALDDYQAAVRNHVNDAPSSHWQPWSNRGYRLAAIESGGLTIVAVWGARAGEVSYAIAEDVQGPCTVSSSASSREFALDKRRVLTHGTCMDGSRVYQPMHSSDAAWFGERVAKGGTLSVRDSGPAVTFDLSGVPVLKARLAAEAAATGSR
jgi:hypothetical protein